MDPLADRGAVRVKADVRGNDRDKTCCRLSPQCQAVEAAVCASLAGFAMLNAGLRGLFVRFLLKLLRCGLLASAEGAARKGLQRRPSLSPHVISFTTNPI